jgi:hypothetical protein
MVRAKRVGAKEKLANAQEEIARLRAALADPQRTADQFMADAPGEGIKILGTEDSAPKVTGGMTKKQQEEAAFGKRWWCKVIELQLPRANDVHQVATWCRSGNRVQMFRANTEVLLPESEINKLENECVIYDEQRVNVGPEGVSLDKAHELAVLRGSALQHDQFGQYFFTRRQNRFMVQRLRPEQESLVVS